MIRVAVSVEGDTEEAFIKDVMYPVFLDREVWLNPINLGGNVSLDRVVPELVRLYYDHDFVTTFYDFYGFKHNPCASGTELEQRILTDVAQRVAERNQWDVRKFRPYIQMYEFEALLFADVNSFRLLPTATEKAILALGSVREDFETPEHINNHPTTAPSKRIQQQIADYDKVEYGPLVIVEIGLDAIRNQCPGFNAWVTWLENLNQ